MKKLFFVCFVLVTSFYLSGCNNSDNVTSSGSEPHTDGGSNLINIYTYSGSTPQANMYIEVTKVGGSTPAITGTTNSSGYFSFAPTAIGVADFLVTADNQTIGYGNGSFYNDQTPRTVNIQIVFY